MFSLIKKATMFSLFGEYAQKTKTSAMYFDSFLIKFVDHGLVKLTRNFGEKYSLSLTTAWLM